jgi:hypothetical protein
MPAVQIHKERAPHAMKEVDCMALYEKKGGSFAKAEGALYCVHDVCLSWECKSASRCACAVLVLLCVVQAAASAARP